LHTHTHFFSFSHKHTLSSSNTCCLYPSSHFTRFFSLFLSHLIYLTLSLSRLISLFFSRLLSLTLSLSLSFLRLITLSLFYQFSLSHTHTHFLPFTCYLLPSFPFPRFLPLSLSVRAKKTAVAEPQQRAQALPTWRDQRHEKKAGGGRRGGSVLALARIRPSKNKPISPKSSSSKAYSPSFLLRRVCHLRTSDPHWLVEDLKSSK
jgi:hypothetical protein